MKIEVLPKIEIVSILSDGTKLVSSSKDALIQTLENKMRGNSNSLSYYAHEIKRLKQEFSLLQKDLEVAKALEE